MADYRELLRRAVEALPENNGASRRQVYEKARSALVAQLRAINPPLPAREITQHRLQLEDCIRQVEQGATDALLGGLKQLDEAEPDVVADDVATAEAADAAEIAAQDDSRTEETDSVETVMAEEPVAEPEAQVDETPEPEPEPEPESSGEAEIAVAPGDVEAVPASHDSAFVASVEPVAEPVDANDALAAALDGEAVADSDYSVSPDADLAETEAAGDDAAEDHDSVAALAAALKAHGNEVSTPVAAEEPRVSVTDEQSVQMDASGSISQLIEEAGITPARRFESKPGSIDMLIAQAQAAAAQAAIPTRWKNDSPVAVLDDDADSVAAMSSVREVEVEAPSEDGDGDPQGTIDRAIEALDREARGEKSPEADTADAAASSLSGQADGGQDSADAEERPRGSNAVTIFLLLLVLLLAGVGGAGYWAWREGYVDLDAMFGQSDVAVADVTTDTETPEVAETNGPGNTVATPDAVPEASQELGKSEERLTSAESLTPVTPAAEPAPVIASSTPDDNKIEERLPAAEAPQPVDEPSDAAQDAAPAVAEVAPIGGQSLLLEASSQGTTGAVPFSGTVDWTRGVDEVGQPTLVATANIPARNLSLNLLIRRNSDPTLPASHLMEVDFTVNESFLGGGIAGLPGVLLKNEELVKGVPLVGASARVVGNSFLFALSAADQDVATNTNLLKSRKWIDLALVYLTGTRAIITLEKDADAQVMFDEVLAAWAAEADTGSVTTE